MYAIPFGSIPSASDEDYSARDSSPPELACDRCCSGEDRRRVHRLHSTPAQARGRQSVYETSRPSRWTGGRLRACTRMFLTPLSNEMGSFVRRHTSYTSTTREVSDNRTLVLFGTETFILLF